MGNRTEHKRNHGPNSVKDLPPHPLRRISRHAFRVIVLWALHEWPLVAASSRFSLRVMSSRFVIWILLGPSCSKASLTLHTQKELCSLIRKRFAKAEHERVLQWFQSMHQTCSVNQKQNKPNLALSREVFGQLFIMQPACGRTAARTVKVKGAGLPSAAWALSGSFLMITAQSWACRKSCHKSLTG